jgi:mannose-6-phosphate isomerase-like protein (cupin superfamily)
MVIFSTLDNLKEELNAHKSGMKRVFIRNSDTDTALTQFAYGAMQVGESSGLHKHDTMDEYFFFFKGSGICVLGEEEIEINTSVFVHIPAGTLHNLIQTGNQILEFVYFGIAT